MPITTAVPRSIYTKAILIDSSALYAIADKKDSHHQEAVDCLLLLGLKKYPLWTTNYNIIESHRRILHELGIAKGLLFLDDINNNSGLTIERSIAGDEQNALYYLHKYDDQDMTYNDAISFAVMKRMSIGTAFTFDGHFTVIGFNKIPPLFF